MAQLSNFCHALKIWKVIANVDCTFLMSLHDDEEYCISHWLVAQCHAP